MTIQMIHHPEVIRPIRTTLRSFGVEQQDLEDGVAEVERAARTMVISLCQASRCAGVTSNGLFAVRRPRTSSGAVARNRTMGAAYQAVVRDSLGA